MENNPLQKAVARARDVEPIPENRALVGPLGLDDIRYTETRVAPIPESRSRERRLVANLEGTPLARRFATLAMRVMLKMRENRFRTLGVVTPTEGTGSSLITANLAVALAREPNHTVIAVDANVRNPGLGEYFDLSGEYGLVDHLLSGVPLPKILVNPGIRKLVLLPNRVGVESAAELLASEKMTNLVKELRDYYDSRIVLFDMPPLVGAADALAMLPQLDCALLVIREGQTSAKDLASAKRALQGTPMVGALVNQSRSDFGRR
jgi:Mrp family chromosome partitioning ATPase